MVRHDVQKHRRGAPQPAVEPRDTGFHFGQSVGEGINAPVQADAGPQFARQRPGHPSLYEIAEHPAGDPTLAGPGQQAMGEKIHAANPRFPRLSRWPSVYRAGRLEAP